MIGVRVPEAPSSAGHGRQAGFDAHLVKPAAYEAIAQILAGAEPGPRPS